MHREPQNCGGDTWSFDSSIFDDPQLIIKAGEGDGADGLTGHCERVHHQTS